MNTVWTAQCVTVYTGTSRTNLMSHYPPKGCIAYNWHLQFYSNCSGLQLLIPNFAKRYARMKLRHYDVDFLLVKKHFL